MYWPGSRVVPARIRYFNRSVAVSLKYQPPMLIGVGRGIPEFNRVASRIRPCRVRHHFVDHDSLRALPGSARVIHPTRCCLARHTICPIDPTGVPSRIDQFQRASRAVGTLRPDRSCHCRRIPRTVLPLASSTLIRLTVVVQAADVNACDLICCQRPGKQSETPAGSSPPAGVVPAPTWYREQNGTASAGPSVMVTPPRSSVTAWAPWLSWSVR